MELIKFDAEVEKHGIDLYQAVVRQATEENKKLFFGSEKPILIVKAINERTAELFADEELIMRLKIEMDLGL